MEVKQLYTTCLAEAAYFIESNGEAAVIDPLRETGPYIELAESRGAKIKYVFETHFHADFVSGHIDLARKTGAEIVFGPTAKCGYDCREANDGEEFKVGDLTIRVLHTPGHTPESCCFLLIDADGEEHCIFTGDTLFIGDVGRPDLALVGDLTKEDLAADLYDSLQNKIMPLSDDIVIYPGHGAGSACGKNLSSETYSTLGEQKKSNYALLANNKEDFVAQVTDGILPPPQYFPKNALMNKQGYKNIDEVLEAGVQPLSVNTVKDHLAKGTLVLDVRANLAFSEKHIPGSVFIGLDGNFATWVGALIEDLTAPIVLIVDAGKEEEAVTRLSRVGYDNCIGYLDGGLEAWQAAGEPVGDVGGISAQEFSTLPIADLNVLDVRKPGEFEAEHVDGAISYPLDYVLNPNKTIDKTQTYHVHCKAGYRSLVAISILRNQGFTSLIDVRGGMDAIAQTNTPLTDFVCPSTK